MFLQLQVRDTSFSSDIWLKSYGKAQGIVFPMGLLFFKALYPALFSLFCIKTFLCPDCSEEEWDKLLELSPLFQLLRKVELKLKEQALDAGLLKGEISGRLDERKNS